LDFLAFTASVYEVGEEIESHRVETGLVHSHRFKPSADGLMFDPDVNYRTFTERSRQKTEDGTGYVVTATSLTSIRDCTPIALTTPCLL
jgi:hypothetical protein